MFGFGWWCHCETIPPQAEGEAIRVEGRVPPTSQIATSATPPRNDKLEEASPLFDSPVGDFTLLKVPMLQDIFVVGSVVLHFRVVYLVRLHPAYSFSSPLLTPKA